MTGPQKLRDLPLALVAIDRLRAEGAQPAPAGEGEGRVRPLHAVQRRCPRFGVDSGCRQGRTDAFAAIAAPRERADPGVGKGRVIHIAARDHRIGKRIEIGRLIACPAALPDPALQVAHKPGPAGLIPLEVADREGRQALRIEGSALATPPGRAAIGRAIHRATLLPQFRPVLNHDAGQCDAGQGSIRRHPASETDNRGYATRMMTADAATAPSGQMPAEPDPRLQQQCPTPLMSGIPFVTGRFATLVEALDYAATGATGFNFYDARGTLVRTYPYRDLAADSVRAAHRLVARGLKAGDRLALIAETSPDFAALFFAALRAGILPVPLPLPTSFGGRQAYVEQIRIQLKSAAPALVLGPDSLAPLFAEAADGVAPALGWSAFGAVDAPEVSLAPPDPEAISYLQYSSGSTRFPHGVAVSHRAVMANLTGHALSMRLGPGDRGVSWLPWYHDMGLVGTVLSTMAAQLSVDFLATDDFARRPLTWLDLISRNPGYSLSYSPTFGYDICARRVSTLTDVAGRFDLSRWRLAGNGADMIRPDICQAFVDAFAPAGFRAEAFTPSYGLAEATLAVSVAPLGQGIVCDLVDEARLAGEGLAESPTDMSKPVRYRAIVDCGVPVEGLTIEIRDADGIALADRQIGRVFVKGLGIMDGYWRDPQATAAVLSADGWLDTGDMGYLVDGHIFIVGRAKDMIILNGKNHWPQDIEWAIEQLEGFKAGDIAAFAITTPQGEEAPAVLVQCRTSDPAERARLKDSIRQKVRSITGMNCVVELVPPRTLPRTSSGKLSRVKARQLYLAGEIVPFEVAA